MLRMMTSMNDVSRTIKRIIVSVETGGFNSSAMQSAVILASRLQADLCGLFIEAPELLEIARLPFTREITLHTTQSRDLSGAAIERHFIAMANQMRHTIEKMAKISNVACSFRTIRGSHLESMISESDDFQLLLILPKKRLTELTHQETSTSKTQSIVLFYDGSVPVSNIIRVIKSLNDNKAMKKLLVLTARESDIEEILNELPSTHYQINFQQVQGYDIGDIINRVKQQSAGLVILPLGGIVQQQRGVFKKLIDTLSCPLILMR